jgi:hypothetical protein
MQMKTENINTGVAAGADAIAAAGQELEAVHAKMAFAPPLTPEDRARLATFGPRSSEVIEKRLAAAWSHRPSLPATFDLRKFEKSARVVIELSKCQKTLERMLVEVRDTLRTLGPPVLAESRSVLGYLKVTAEGAGQVHSTVGELKFRARAGRRSTGTSVPVSKGAEPSAEGTASPNVAPAPAVTPARPATPSADPEASKAA